MFEQAIAALQAQVSVHERHAQFHHDRVAELHAAIGKLNAANNDPS